MFRSPINLTEERNRAMPLPLKCPGAGRDAENLHTLVFSFSRRVTDDELRFLHEVMQRAVACMPDPDRCPTCGRPANANGGTEECRRGGCGLGGDF